MNPRPRISIGLPGVLLILFFILWIALGVAPRYRQDWVLENVLVVIAVPILIRLHRNSPFPSSHCIAVFAFGVLHEIGAHYTYSEVPYDRWFEAMSGVSLESCFGFSRNHYDRAIHFFYGLLITPLAIYIIGAQCRLIGGWRWLLPVCFITSHSVVYELVEWLAALVFGGELQTAYLGTQGDVWDAQADMALALAGSALAATMVLWRQAMPAARTTSPRVHVRPDDNFL